MYQPSNRRLCQPGDVAFVIGAAVPFCVDDAREQGETIVPIAWGREGSDVRVVSYYNGKFTLCDARGAFLKEVTCRRGEGKRRVKLFTRPEQAALFAVEHNVEECK